LPYPLYYQPVANEEAPFDTCYHLLNLFVQRGYDLNLTFAPSGSTPHQLDYRLSWYLWIILSDIAFVHLDLKDLALLHVNFAIQLEAVGLWVWSIFVLQHLNTPSHRGRSVWEVLCRNCSHQETLTEEETFVIERLKVPCGLMHRAKAVSAHYFGEYRLQAFHLLKGAQWNEAHDIIISHIAPRAIIENDTQFLYSSLRLLAEPDHSISILSWDTTGSVYLDYLKLSEMIDELKNLDNVALSQIEDINAGLLGIVVRVRSLPDSTPYDCLCQTEISKRAISLSRAVSQLKVCFLWLYNKDIYSVKGTDSRGYTSFDTSYYHSPSPP
jgi:nuclear pore complex protein Nup98-Nup96